MLIGRDELAGGIHGFVKYAKTGATDLRHWLQLSNAGTVDYLCKTGGYGSAGWACPSPAPPSRA